ncbi:hypothetical protein [Clostridium perfringens]|uniref:hypothetical protein n=1 Tax=Clostridium perfringens TaxID=1502 RepID=UPI001B81CE2E|nr:hypothetical protein [Clostridium perfringens]HBC2032844.1 hypothetical protein [Clostridium perfringens]HBC2055073.1 hypothetical protein [Clostridium perfringens]HBC2069797.1 hypothetical protein [Clostridium perfringens]
MEDKLSKEEELFIKRFQKHIEADQEEVKHALNINRQQRKQQLRRKEKELRAVKNLTPTQIGVMTKLLNKEKEKMDISIEETRMSTYSCINAALTELYNFKNKELIKIWDTTNNLLEEDIKARRGLGELSKEEMDKLDKNVKTRVGELIYEGKKQKEIIETLKKEFPKLSAAMRINVYKEVKEEIEEVKKAKDEKVEKMNEEMKKINKEVIEIKDELQKQTGIESEGMAKAILASARGVMKEVGYIDTDIIKTGVIKEKSIVEQLEEKISTCIQSKRKVTEEIERLRKIISDREEYLKELNEEGNSLNRALDILKPLNV